jgi:hypothetical protein
MLFQGWLCFAHVNRRLNQRDLRQEVQVKSFAKVLPIGNILGGIAPALPAIVMSRKEKQRKWEEKGHCSILP